LELGLSWGIFIVAIPLLYRGWHNFQGGKFILPVSCSVYTPYFTSVRLSSEWVGFAIFYRCVLWVCRVY